VSLRAQGITVGYSYSVSHPGHEVLTGVDVELHPGEIVALVGPNGAGKSTLIRLLSRVLEPQRGVVTLGGVPLKRFGRMALARQVAVVPQGHESPQGFTALQLVFMGRTPHLGFLSPERRLDHQVVEASMLSTDTWKLRHRRLEELSGGERQRVVLARALAQEPRYLLLDEPTNNLDLRYQVELLRLTRRIAEGGRGVLLVLHDLNLAARASDRLVMLHRGRVVARGPAREVLEAARLRHIYRTEVTVADTEGGLPLVVPKL